MENQLQLINKSYSDILENKNSDVANLIKIKRAINNLSSKNQIFFVQNKIDDTILNDIERIKKENKELKEMLLSLVEIVQNVFNK
jgi:hypothetical protein